MNKPVNMKLIVLGVHAAERLHLFRKSNWDILQVDTLTDAEDAVVQWRGVTVPVPQPVVLLMSLGDATGIDSWMLAAYLSSAMESRTLLPTPLVLFTDITDDPVLRRRYELAGCIWMPVPRSLAQVTGWASLAINSTVQKSTAMRDPLYQETLAREAAIFREASSAAYRILAGRVRPFWTAEEVRILLAGFRAGVHRRRTDLLLLDRLGGVQAARATLFACAEALGVDQRNILKGILQGSKQKELGKELYRTREWVNRHLAAMSICIAEWLNSHQPLQTPPRTGGQGSSAAAQTPLVS